MYPLALWNVNSYVRAFSSDSGAYVCTLEKRIRRIFAI